MVSDNSWVTLHLEVPFEGNRAKPCHTPSFPTSLAGTPQGPVWGSCYPLLSPEPGLAFGLPHVVLRSQPWGHNFHFTALNLLSMHIHPRSWKRSQSCLLVSSVRFSAVIRRGWERAAGAGGS